jgi:hypothetical protein
MSDQIVVINVGLSTYTFSKLQRHLLYSADERRFPSLRLYDPFEIVEARLTLETMGLIVEGQLEPQLTPLGAEVVTALRSRKS